MLKLAIYLILFFITIFVKFESGFLQAILNLVHDTALFALLIVIYLWVKKELVLLGLVFFTIEWNMDLLQNSLLQIENSVVLSREFLVIKFVLKKGFYFEKQWIS